MLRSQLFTKTIKEISSEEQSINAQLLTRGGFIDKVMAGVYSYLPLGLRVLRKIEQIIREEMNAIGGQEILMPALQPKENWQATHRWDGFDALYKVKSHSDQEFALGPTHEEIVVPLAKKMIASYRDLPLYLYQIQTKFRDEPRAKSGILRGREFAMKDLYSFHADEADLDKYYEIAKGAYLKIFKRLELGVLVTEASGGTFSKYSHEFQALCEAGEDLVFYCACGWAQNKEIAEAREGDPCQRCKNKIKTGKAIEVGNIFKLNTKYSDPFNLVFKNQDGKDKPVLMGCYGMGSSRIMGALAEIKHDDKGVIWPKEVAPFEVVVVAINSKDTEKNKTILKESQKLYQTLSAIGGSTVDGQKQKIEVLYDDRQDVTSGEKFTEADLWGIPWRVVISEKTLKEEAVELKKRSEEKVKLIKVNEVIDYVR